MSTDVSTEDVAAGIARWERLCDARQELMWCEHLMVWVDRRQEARVEELWQAALDAHDALLGTRALRQTYAKVLAAELAWEYALHTTDFVTNQERLWARCEQEAQRHAQAVVDAGLQSRFMSVSA